MALGQCNLYKSVPPKSCHSWVLLKSSSDQVQRHNSKDRVPPDLAPLSPCASLPNSFSMFSLLQVSLPKNICNTTSFPMSYNLDIIFSVKTACLIAEVTETPLVSAFQSSAGQYVGTTLSQDRVVHSQRSRHRLTVPCSSQGPEQDLTSGSLDS